LDAVDATLAQLTKHYRSVYKEAERAKEERIAALTASPELRSEYFRVLDKQRNESLADIVTNKNDVNVIVEYQGELVQKSDPVYQVPQQGLFAAQFYAPTKRFLGMQLSTKHANILVLWIMSLLMGLALYAEIMPRVAKLAAGRRGR
jgi:hypothetical protein